MTVKERSQPQAKGRAKVDDFPDLGQKFGSSVCMDMTPALAARSNLERLAHSRDPRTIVRLSI